MQTPNSLISYEIDPLNADAKIHLIINEVNGAIYLIRSMPYGTGLNYTFNVMKG